MNERMSPRFEDIANDFVNDVEDEHMYHLFQWETDSQRRAASCGCRQCKHEAEKVATLVAQELGRLCPSGHEEELETDISHAKQTNKK